MMFLPTTATRYRLIRTFDPETNEPMDADETPTLNVLLNGVSNGVSVTVQNLTTGVYLASYPLSGFSVGDQLTDYPTGTVNGVTDNGEPETVVVSAIEARVANIASGSTVVRADDRDGEAVAKASIATETRLARLDATVSSRSTLTAGDVWSNATRSLTDKDGFALSAEGVTAVQDGLATSQAVSDLADAVDGIADGVDGSDSKQDQLIALFQAGLPDVGPGQQRGARRVVKGDTYSSTGRQSLITKHKNADWPTDLSEWTWAFTASKHPDNENDGDALAGSVDVVTATGDSRGLRINHTKAQTMAAAVGRHLYAVRGTNSGDSSIVWTVELGVVDVEEAATE